MLRAIRQSFRIHGYDGSTLSLLSEATGLKRASLYYRFPGGKEEMAMAVIDDIANLLKRDVFALLESDRRPVDRIDSMVLALSDLYDGGRNMCLLSVMSLGDAPASVRKEIERVSGAWLGCLERFALQIGHSKKGARDVAERVLVEIHGGLILSAQFNDQRPFRAALGRIKGILLPP